MKGSGVRLPSLPGWYDVLTYPVIRDDGSEGSIYLIRNVTDKIKSEQEFQ